MELEVSIEKTRFVNFSQDDFKFIGYGFKHWRSRKKDSSCYFIVMPTENSLKISRKISRTSALVMDNCKAHKGKKASGAFLKAGVAVL